MTPADDPNAAQGNPANAEAASWRHRYRDEQAARAADKEQHDAANAELVGTVADIAARLRATERQLVDHHIGGKMNDTRDFPHYAAPGSATVPTGTVSSIGFPGTSVLNPSPSTEHAVGCADELQRALGYDR
jgi:hypothetical protein